MDDSFDVFGYTDTSPALSDDAFNASVGIDPNTTDATFAQAASTTDLTGNNNSLPTVSTNTPASSAAYGQVLGSVTPQTAQNLGTAIGTLERNLQAIPGAFSAGKNAASSGNSLSTWWLYASTTDKLVVGIGLLTLVYMIAEHE